MKYRKTLTCGSVADSPFRHIIIDYKMGHQIRLNGVEVGRFILRDEVWKDNVKVSLLDGIEIDPEYRGKGIGRAVIRQLMERVDMIVGSITEDDCKPFWRAMGAKFYDLPVDVFPDKVKETIHTDTPLFFYITKNPKAAEYAQTIGEKLPDLLRSEVGQEIWKR